MAEWLFNIKLSMAFLESFLIYVTCVVRSCLLRNQRILFHSDNSGTVAIWSKSACGNRAIMEIVRRIRFTAARQNFVVKTVHFPGINNAVAESLSRFQHERFLELVPNVSPEGTFVPDVLQQLRSLVQLKDPTVPWTEPSNSSCTPERHPLLVKLTTVEDVDTSHFADL